MMLLYCVVVLACLFFWFHACSLFCVSALCGVWCFFGMEEGIRWRSITYSDFDILSRTKLNVKTWLAILVICKGHIHIAQKFRSDSSRDWKKKISWLSSHTTLRLIHAYELVGSISPAHDHQPFLFLLQPCNYKSVVGLPCLLFCFSIQELPCFVGHLPYVSVSTMVSAP